MSQESESPIDYWSLLMPEWDRRKVGTFLLPGRNRMDIVEVKWNGKVFNEPGSVVEICFVKKRPWWKRLVTCLTWLK